MIIYYLYSFTYLLVLSLKDDWCIALLGNFITIPMNLIGQFKFISHFAKVCIKMSQIR